MAAQPGGPHRTGSDPVGGADTASWRRGFRVSGFSVVMLVLLVLGVVVIAPTLHALVLQRQQIAALQGSVDAQRDRIAELKADRARWSDPSYIRAEARDRLLYVLPGETSYLIIDDRSAAARSAGGSVSTKLQRTRADWLAAFGDSVLTAGLTDRPASSLDGATVGGGASTPAVTPSKPTPAGTPASTPAP